MLFAVDDFLGIPVRDRPSRAKFRMVYPEGATKVRIICGGQGRNMPDNGEVVTVGVILTWLLNIIYPSYMLGYQVSAGISQDVNKDIKAFGLVSTGKLLYGLKGVLEKLLKENVVDWCGIAKLLKMLFEAELRWLYKHAVKQIVAEKAAQQIPGVGFALIAISIAENAAKIASTTYDITRTPFEINNDVKGTITSKITIYPDPTEKAWPQAQIGEKAVLRCRMIYSNEKRPPVVKSFDVPDDFTKVEKELFFEKNTLGGEVRFEVEYSINEWIAAKSATIKMPNDLKHTSNVKTYLVQIPVPIKKDTIFKHSKKLIYQNNKFKWFPTSKAPTSTILNLNNSPGNSISMLNNLSYSSRKGVIGISYKAGGTGLKAAGNPSQPVSDDHLFAFQSVNIPGRPMEDVKFTKYGFENASVLVYDPFPPKFEKDENGQWKLDEETNLPIPDPKDLDLGNYYIDPRKSMLSLDKEGGFYLRRVNVEGKEDFNPNSTKPADKLGYARFSLFPDHITMHPSGFVIGVNQNEHAVMITPFMHSKDSSDFPIGKEDSELPVGRNFGGEALTPEREGRLFNPLAVSCNYDGLILILEQKKGAGQDSVARVQALDLEGSPVQSFLNSAKEDTSLLTIKDNVTYLDMQAVGNEASTLLFISYYKGSGRKIEDYSVDVYTFGLNKATGKKHSEFTLTIPNIPAVRIAINVWHYLYTLNCEMTTDEQGNPSGPSGNDTGPLGRTVPSVSQWLPSAPKP